MPVNLIHSSNPAKRPFGQARHDALPKAAEWVPGDFFARAVPVTLALHPLVNSAQPVRFGGRLSKFTTLPTVPVPAQVQDPGAYSEPLSTGEARYLQMRRALGSGWEFVHRFNAKGAIHNVVIVRDDDSQKTPYVVMNVTHSPVFGGLPKIMLPAGLWADKNAKETFAECALREVREETGLENIRVYPLAGEALFAASGGLTTERKGFTVCIAEGTPNLKHLDGREKINRHYLVPLKTFLDTERFKAWLLEVEQKGYMVESDIITARSLLDQEEPPLSSMDFTA